MTKRRMLIIIAILLLDLIFICKMVGKAGAQSYPPPEPTLTYIYLPVVVNQNTILGTPVCIPEPVCLPRHDYDGDN